MRPRLAHRWHWRYAGLLGRGAEKVRDTPLSTARVNIRPLRWPDACRRERSRTRRYCRRSRICFTFAAPFTIHSMVAPVTLPPTRSRAAFGCRGLSRPGHQSFGTLVASPHRGCSDLPVSAFMPMAFHARWVAGATGARMLSTVRPCRHRRASPDWRSPGSLHSPSSRRSAMADRYPGYDVLQQAQFDVVERSDARRDRPAHGDRS